MEKINVEFGVKDLKIFTELCRQNGIKWDITEMGKNYIGYIKYTDVLTLAMFTHALGWHCVLITFKPAK